MAFYKTKCLIGHIIRCETKNAVRSILFKSGLLAKRTNVDWNNALRIICQENEKPMYVAASNIFYIHTKNIKGYLRAVCRHTSYKKSVLDAIETWYSFIHPEQTVEYAVIKKTLSNRPCRKKFFDMGYFDNPYSRARHFYETKDTTIVGIITPHYLVKGTEEWKVFIRNIHDLLRYVRNVMVRYRRNQGGGQWEFSGVNRQMATEAIAKMIGLDYMIPHSEWAVVSYQDQVLYGLLMSVAEGENSEGISGENSRAIASPMMQRDLTSLNMLDAITFERDHRPGNYNIVIGDDGRVSRIAVFDNDAEMTFAPFPVYYQSVHGSSCFLCRSGEVNRPYLDKRIAMKVLDLDVSEFRKALQPYLNHIQLFACCNRLRKVQEGIRKTKDNKVFLLEDAGWSYSTISTEVSGKYGMTYLRLFLDWERITKQFYEDAHNMDL